MAVSLAIILLDMRVRWFTWVLHRLMPNMGESPTVQVKCEDRSFETAVTHEGTGQNKSDNCWRSSLLATSEDDCHPPGTMATLLEQAIDLEQHSLAGHPGEFPAPVCPHSFQAAVKKFFQENEEGMATVETPAEEMRQIEALLEAPEGFFSVPYVVRTKMEACPNCSRRNTFLDVVKTALAVHTPAFLRDVFTGKHGHIINSAPTQRCECFGCGLELPEEATKFSAPRFPTDAESRRPEYLYPVYNYRF